jgi:molecular chaperone GrpE
LANPIEKDLSTVHPADEPHPENETPQQLAAMPERSQAAGTDAATQGGCPPGETGAGETRTALDGLAARLAMMAEQLAEFHRRSAHRESVIDRLHEENQQLRSGMSRVILEPVVADLIRLHDQVEREVRRLRADGQDERLLWSFADDIAQILDRCGIEIYSAEPGDPFDRDRHRALAVVACTDESRHNTVAEMVASGFTERETGRVRRPVQARFHQYTPAREPVPDGGTARSQ